MKKLTRILSIALAAVMLMTMVGTAFAGTPSGGIEYADGAEGNWDKPVTSSAPARNTITFVAGDEYELTAKAGTSKDQEGNVRVYASSGVLNEAIIPDAAGADAYYKPTGWAIQDEDGNLIPIDLKTYRFTKDEKVYAVVEDIWVPYKDMNQNRTDWYYKYVRDLSIAGVVGGFPDNTFRAKNNLTYGQALKLVMLATGYSEQAPTDKHWASGYYTKALADGLVTETGINLDRSIKRSEVAEIAALALKLAEPKIKTPYADTELKAALQLFEAGIMEGSFDAAGSRLFKPDNYITRAEISAIVWRINHYTK